jgi:hypothetical protein
VVWYVYTRKKYDDEDRVKRRMKEDKEARKG